ncbi:MAG: T9SS type A sorting domain-containing protein [Bacteroidetes bacterium]|nr:T9SS type A sorting domain-containing protein [Bacteroidota bacterium]
MCTTLRLQLLALSLISILFIDYNLLYAQNSSAESLFQLGADAPIVAMIEDEQGNLYFGGQFAELGGQTGRVVMYDGENFHSLGFPDRTTTSPRTTSVNALAIRGDYLYAGGFFNVIEHNGETIPARNLAKYHIPTNTWTEAGGGVNDMVSTIVLDGNNLYVGGAFTFAYGEVANITLNRIGILSSNDNWSQIKVGTTDHEFIGFAEGGVSVVYRDPLTDNLYFGGSFERVRMFDSDFEQFDGYRSRNAGGIVRWTGSAFQLVGGGLHRQLASSIVNGVVRGIHRDPYGSGLYVTGSFGIAYNSERTENALSSHNPDIHPPSSGIAVWSGGSWSGEMAVESGRGGGGSVTHGVHFTEDRIYLYGSFNNFVQPPANNVTSSQRAGGMIAWDRSAGRYLIENGESSIGYAMGENLGATNAPIRVALQRDDGLYLAGDNVRQRQPDGQIVRANRLMRYDGESYWQVGNGTDGTVMDIVRELSNGDILLGGNFERIYNSDNTNYETPLVARYNTETNKLSPIGGGISRAGLTNARVYTAIEDTLSGDIYIGGSFLTGINSDGSEVQSRSLLRWSDGAWHAVGNGFAGPSTGSYSSKVRALKIIDGYLYIGGYFSNIPDRDPNQYSIGRLNLETQEFSPIPIPDDLTLTNRLVVDFEATDEHIYVMMESRFNAPSFNGSIFRIHRETDEIDRYNRRFMGDRSHQSIQALGDFLLVSGRFSTYQTLDDDGNILEQLPTGSSSLVFHPETDTWWPVENWPEDTNLNQFYFSNQALVYENSLYFIANSNVPGKLLQRKDLGTGEWSVPDENLFANYLVGSSFVGSQHIEVIGDRLWVGGSFTVPSKNVTNVPLDAGTPAPHLMFTPPSDEFNISSGSIDTLTLAFANIGSESLNWSISAGGQNIPESLIRFSATQVHTAEKSIANNDAFTAGAEADGIIAPRRYGTITVIIDASEVPTSLNEVEITITTNDARYSEITIPLNVYIDRLTDVESPNPADGGTDVAINGTLRWVGDQIADSVVVYLGLSPDFTEENIVYAGAFTDSLSLGGLVDYYTDYFWKVHQYNASSATESDVWSFRTELNPDENIWVLRETDFTTQLTDIHWASADTGFVMGSNIIYRTIDAGDSWSVLDGLASGTRFGLSATGRTLWQGKSSGNLIVTHNAGDTWNQINTEVSTNLRSVYFMDEQRGWVGGDNGSIQYTTDGGEIWTVSTSDNIRRINKIAFADENTGYAVGQFGTLLKTTDGGSNWSQIDLETTSHQLSLYVKSADTLFVGGASARLLKSTDGGQNWITQFETTRNQNQIQDIRFLDENTGWAVGLVEFTTPLMLTTFDGGVTWAQRPTGLESGIINGLFTSETLGVWAVGVNGALLHYVAPEEDDPTEPGDGDAPTLPLAIALTGPDNNAVDVDRQPTFEWEADTIAVSYQIQVALDADFDDILVNVASIETTDFTPGEQLNANTLHYWRVRGIGADGSGEWSAVWSFTTRTGVGLNDGSDLPTVVTLDQNYPNPFNPTTTIRFGLPEAVDVRLEVFNVLGQRVAILAQDTRTAGWHTVQFNGSSLSSGTYIYRLTAGNTVHTRMFMLIK